MSQPTYKPVRDGGHTHNGVVIAVDRNTLGLTKVGPKIKLQIHELPPTWRLCEPIETPKADWLQAPEWGMWWACDPNGWASWYQEEPVLHITVSYSGWIAMTINGIEQGASLWAKEIEIPLGIDWRTLIEQRPTEATNGTQTDL